MDLSEIYAKQDAIFEEKKKEVSSQELPNVGVFSFVIGIILLFVLFEFEEMVIPIFPISIVLIVIGGFLLRERISVIKPLIAGSILVYFGFGAIAVGLLGILIGINSIETYGLFITVVSLIVFSLGVPISIGAICAIIRKKHRFSLLGGVLSIFIGVILDPLAVLLAIFALILLFISEAEFKN